MIRADIDLISFHLSMNTGWIICNSVDGTGTAGLILLLLISTWEYLSYYQRNPIYMAPLSIWQHRKLWWDGIPS